MGNWNLSGNWRAQMDAWKKIVLAGNLVLITCAIQVAHGLDFAQPTQVADFGASGTCVGDLDNDGRPEFVDGVSGGNGKRLRAYKWNGSGFTSYNILTKVSGRKDRFVGDIELADLNNDGFLDVIVPDSANSSSLAGALTWFENPDGNLGGTWTEHTITTWSGTGTGNEIHHMSDVVARDIDHGFWVMIRSSGGTGWQTRKFVPCNPREGLTLFNPDGDGDLDILLNGVWFQTSSNPVTGTYTLRPIVGAEPWYPSGSSSAQINNYACKVEVADFNGDGREDFVITNAEELSAGSTPTKPKGIRLFLQPANPITGTWSEVIVTSANYGWHTLQIGDIDGDGDLDIYSGRAWDGSEIAVSLNNGPGTSFTKQTVQATKVYQGRMGDVDGDGDPDLWAPLEFNNGAVLFFENLGGTGGGADTQPPSVPSGLVAAAVSSSQINLSWNPSSDNVGVSGYRIYRGGSQIATSSGSSYSDTGLAASTTYTYKVAAYDAANNVSAQSSAASAATQGASQNLALGKTVTVSSGTGAGYLTDGLFTTTSRWFADYGYPQWAEVNLGGNYLVNQVVFSQNTQRTDAWEAQVWSGSAWTTVSSGSGNTNLNITAGFTPVSTNRVRFVVTAGQLYLKVHELEILGNL